MDPQRPLFQHIRDHDALFSELALLRNDFVQQLGLLNYDYHKVPKFVTEDGQRLTIEPERSIVVRDYQCLKGVKSLLEKTIEGFHLIPKSDIGFRYPTAAIAGADAPFIKRFRSEFFHKTGEHRNICRPLNLSYGIKSRGKGDNRQEYEVWVPDDNLTLDPTPLFVEKYGEDLPDDVRAFAAQEPVVHGWMGVKRSAFEAVLWRPSDWGEIAIILGLSVDAYNIGARPDLSFSHQVGSSIALSNAELEWEVMGFYAPKGVHFKQSQIWSAINASIESISAPLVEHYHDTILPVQESKTERILSTLAGLGVTDHEILHWNLKPWEFLKTESHHRRKQHDPSRSINLLGRLNRLFYQDDARLPSLKAIHDLIAQ